MDKTINAKELRASLPDVVKKVRGGQRFLVLYRSRPAFRLVPVEGPEASDVPLDHDPLYRAEALGRSSDGRTSKDHDLILYGPSTR